MMLNEKYDDILSIEEKIKEYMKVNSYLYVIKLPMKIFYIRTKKKKIKVKNAFGKLFFF